ncbi:MAG: ABC transporter ATP-binding protein [Thermomicrobiales bacterium]|nr:ABC transporter ATP-binding protein [Thermomicrobiales bacterium]
MTHSDAVIVTTRLSKQFGPVAALDQLSLSVPRGTVYGFLGPNGAGKTTAIKILMGFIRPSSGSATIFGHDTWRHGVAAREGLGFLVQPDNLYPDMTGAAHLRYAERLNDRRATLRPQLLDALELSAEALNRKLGSYSKGMRQKLALIAAMQHDPELVVLDEPTDGLDPLIQRNFEVVLRDLRARGRTIFMSSHDLAEVERTCELIAVVKGGRLVTEETVDGLKRLQRRRATISTQNGALDAVAALPGVTIAERSETRITVLIDGDLNPLLRLLANSGVDDLVLAPPSLDDIFMGFYDQSNRTVTPR